MEKIYEAPELDIVKVKLSRDVLVVSVDETTASGGTIIDPGPGMEDDGQGW